MSGPILAINAVNTDRTHLLDPHEHSLRDEIATVLLETGPYAIFTTWIHDGPTILDPWTGHETASAVLTIGLDLDRQTAACHYTGPAGEDYPAGGWYSHNPEPPHPETRLPLCAPGDFDDVFPYSSHVDFAVAPDVLEEFRASFGRLPRQHLDWELAEIPGRDRAEIIPDLAGEWVADVACSEPGLTTITTCRGWSITIRTTLTFTTPLGETTLDGSSAATPALLREALHLQIIRSINASTSSALIVEFAGQSLLWIEADPDFEAWRITHNTDDIAVACMPGGDLAPGPPPKRNNE